MSRFAPTTADVLQGRRTQYDVIAYNITLTKNIVHQLEETKEYRPSLAQKTLYLLNIIESAHLQHATSTQCDLEILLETIMLTVGDKNQDVSAIANLTERVTELEKKNQEMTFHRLFGDFAAHVWYQLKKKANIRVANLDNELYNEQERVDNMNMCTDDEYYAKLAAEPCHQVLIATAKSLKIDFWFLFSFRQSRNDAFHNGAVYMRKKEKKKLINKATTLLENPNEVPDQYHGGKCEFQAWLAIYQNYNCIN